MLNSALNAADLQSTRAFWDSNPCGASGDFGAQRTQRYMMEPWLPGQIKKIAAHRTILEVGCGQGVDSILLCSTMSKDGRYVGIDYSPESIKAASANAASKAGDLAVTPEYRLGNAEALDFADRSIDAVYSMGVIHHTARPPKAIAEIHRVLGDGGTAYIALYRRPSLKVGVAKALRAIQSCLDAISASDRCVYRMLRRRGHSSNRFGTMFLECFGVPHMEWYSRREIGELFSSFSNVDVKICGNNFGGLGLSSRSGYMWFVEATK